MKQPDIKSYKSRLYHIYNNSEVKYGLNWKAKPKKPMPVMITVANRTETTARIKHAFDHSRVHISELCDPF